MHHGARTGDSHPLLLVLLVSALAFLLVATAFGDIAYAYPQGPPPDAAGNPPGNFSCQTFCHFDFPENFGDGGLSIDGLPANYVPGATYNLMVTLFDPGQQRWGFELTVLDDSNQQAGTLVVTDPSVTQLDESLPERDFLMHVFDGTYAGTPDGPVSWPFQWVAPSLPNVTFYVAGNATNWDDSPAGDYVYTRQVALTQATTAVEPGSWGRIKALYADR